jgi:hypothetical protein
MGLGRQGDQQGTMYLAWDEIPWSRGHAFFTIVSSRFSGKPASMVSPRSCASPSIPTRGVPPFRLAGIFGCTSWGISRASTDGGTQCFPLYLYDEPKPKTAGKAERLSLMETPEPASSKPATTERTRREAITDEKLAHFQSAYPGEAITKEDIFYYVYGLLHSPDYRERYADNLTKELPRIPCVKAAADFWAFGKAGRALAYWHLNYETVEPYPLTIQISGVGLADCLLGRWGLPYHFQKFDVILEC